MWSYAFLGGRLLPWHHMSFLPRLSKRIVVLDFTIPLPVSFGIFPQHNLIARLSNKAEFYAHRPFKHSLLHLTEVSKDQQAILTLSNAEENTTKYKQTAQSRCYLIAPS